jgi:hypothetical protein
MVPKGYGVIVFDWLLASYSLVIDIKSQIMDHGSEKIHLFNIRKIIKENVGGCELIFFRLDIAKLGLNKYNDCTHIIQRERLCKVDYGGHLIICFCSLLKELGYC